MRKRLFSALAALLVGGGLAQAQYYPPPGYPAPVPAYGTPYGMPQAGMPYPAMPGARPALHGMPGGYPTPYAAPVGRASVGDTTPPRSAVPSELPPAEIHIKPEPKAPATVVPAVPATVVPAVPVHRADVILPDLRCATGFKKHRHDNACGPDCREPACGPRGACDRPCEPVCGMPLMCDVDCHGQPLVDRELDRQPRGYCAYLRLDFLRWWVDQQTSPTLANATSIQGTRAISAGTFDNGERIGTRSTVGFWVDSHNKIALEGSFLYLFNRNPSFTVGTPTITRPFFNLATGAADAIVVASPGISTGAAGIDSHFRFHSGEINIRNEVCRWCWGHIDLLGGFRYLRLDEDLNVTTSTVTTAGGVLLASDRFDTENTFCGFQIGIEGEANWDRWFFNPYGKFAVGNNSRIINVNGNRVGPGQPGSVAGGLLAVPTNIGRNRDEELAFVPEIGFNVGFRLSQGCRIHVGYTGLLLSNAARPGDQINVNINPTQLQLPGGPPAAPTGPLGPFYNGAVDRVFWAQGINAGVEFRW